MAEAEGKSAFELVVITNELFGNPKGHINNVNWSAAEAQLELIEAEVKELREAIEKRDVIAMRDGIGDVQVTNLGLAHRTGIDADADMVAIFESNLTKLCVNQDVLAATLYKYDNLGVPTTIHGEFPKKYVKVAETTIGNDGKRYEKGKFLKGVMFREPIFD